MRILHVIPSMNPADGGPVTAVHGIVNKTARLGYRNEVLALDPPDARWLKDIPFSVTPLGPGRGPLRSSRLRDWMTNNAKRFDVAVVHGLWLSPTRSARETWLRTGLPYVVYTHGMLDVAHRRTFPMRHLKKSLWWLTCERRVLADAAALLFTCDAERLLAANTFWPRLSFEHARIAPCCVEPPPGDEDQQIAAFRSTFPQLTDARLLLFLSRIHPKKGVDLLLDAFIKLAHSDPRLMLMVAGPGDEQYIQLLKRRARSAGIAERVIWPGMLLGDLKWGALRSAELFCLPSHQENFGIAITEALACGTPVLITDRVNISTMIDEAGAAIVCKDSQKATFEALHSWLLCSEAKRLQMSEAANRCFQQEFQSDVAAARFHEAIASVRAPVSREGSLAATNADCWSAAPMK